MQNKTTTIYVENLIILQKTKKKDGNPINQDKEKHQRPTINDCCGKLPIAICLNAV